LTDRDCSIWLKIPSTNRFSQCDVCASFKLLKEGLTKSQKGKYLSKIWFFILSYGNLFADPTL
jgi:hypothetical protein